MASAALLGSSVVVLYEGEELMPQRRLFWTEDMSDSVGALELRLWPGVHWAPIAHVAVELHHHANDLQHNTNSSREVGLLAARCVVRLSLANSQRAAASSFEFKAFPLLYDVAMSVAVPSAQPCELPVEADGDGGCLVLLTRRGECRPSAFYHISEHADGEC